LDFLLLILDTDFLFHNFVEKRI